MGQVDSLYENISPILFSALNQLNKVQYSDKQWKIISGHFLRRFLHVVFDRLENSYWKNKRVNYTLQDDFEIQVPQTSLDFVYLADQEAWNRALIRVFPPSDVSILNALKNISSSYHQERIKTRIFNYIKCSLSFTSNLVAKRTTPVIVSSYLSFFDDLKIKFSVRSFLFPFFPSSTFKACSKAKRKLLHDLLLSRAITTNHEITKTKYFWVALSSLPLVIPVCYLEGFDGNRLSAKRLALPSNPKFIFTSNSFDFNEIFKIWLAEKILLGTKYIVGQHGNNYGTKYNFLLWPEVECSDYFFGWGDWPVKPNNFVNTGIFIKKLLNMKGQIDGTCLIIRAFPSQMINIYETPDRTLKSIYDLESFCKQNMPVIRKSTLIRLHHASTRSNFINEMSYLNSVLEYERVLSGHDSLITELSRSRLVIFFYDSTGLLELINSDVPTIIYCPNACDHLTDTAFRIYKTLLKDAGIMHSSADELSRFVNSIWENTIDWWKSDAVKAARHEFSRYYADSKIESMSIMKTLMSSI